MSLIHRKEIGHLSDIAFTDIKNDNIHQQAAKPQVRTKLQLSFFDIVTRRCWLSCHLCSNNVTTVTRNSLFVINIISHVFIWDRGTVFWSFLNFLIKLKPGITMTELWTYLLWGKVFHFKNTLSFPFIFLCLTKVPLPIILITTQQARYYYLHFLHK